MQRLSAVLALLVAVPIVAAQSTSSSTGIASPGQGMSSQSGSSSQERNAADDISAIAPPFDVYDVLRMHRVGLQDEVIINALRARYHPLKLSDSDRALLVKNSVSAAVIAAMENPLGEDTAGHAAPPTVLALPSQTRPRLPPASRFQMPRPRTQIPPWPRPLPSRPEPLLPRRFQYPQRPQPQGPLHRASLLPHATRRIPRRSSRCRTRIHRRLRGSIVASTEQDGEQ